MDLLFMLCVWAPLKMCQPMSLPECYAKMEEYQRRGIQASCQPIAEPPKVGG